MKTTAVNGEIVVSVHLLDRCLTTMEPMTHVPMAFHLQSAHLFIRHLVARHCSSHTLPKKKVKAVLFDEASAGILINGSPDNPPSNWPISFAS
jgi:hypothetical protein